MMVATTLFPSRSCCVPGCKKPAPRTDEIPLCLDCGIQVALVYRHRADRYDALLAAQQEHATAVRNEVRERRQRDSVVYYVRVDEGRVKIGYTHNIRTRLGQLRLTPDRVLALEPGGRETERERHAQFRSDRIHPRREDFELTDALRTWIQVLKSRHPLPHEFRVPDTSVRVRKRK